MDVRGFVNSLSEEQRAAALHTRGPVMTLAGAGSGKTRMLVGRLLHLIGPEADGGLGADPSSVMMVTFTNKAAREMRERVLPVLEELQEREPNRRIGEPWIGTFHGLSLRILRVEASRAGLGPNFSIFDEADARSLLNDVIEEMGIDQFDADEFFRDLETAKARVLSPDFLMKGRVAAEAGGPTADRWRSVLAHFRSDRFIEVYDRYQRALEEQNAVDFSDLLNRTTRLFRDVPEVRDSWRSTFRHFMVDEVQDINRAQVAWLMELTGGGEETRVEDASRGHEHAEAGDGLHEINTYRLRRFPRPTIAFVGDDDQSIYGFRGSEVAVMHGLRDRFADLDLRFMGTSYRCQPMILDAANALVRQNSDRFGKDLTPHGKAERFGKVRFRKAADPAAEIQHLAKEAEAYIRDGGEPSEFAILIRTRDIAKQVAKELRARGLPVVEGKSSDIRKTMEVKDAMSFVTALVNPDAEVPVRRIINKPSRGLGPTSLRKVNVNARLKNVTFLQELRSVMMGRVEVPDGGEPYPTRFTRDVRDFGLLLDRARTEASRAPNAGAAIVAALNATGYLPDLYRSALKSAGLVRHEAETADLGPREFLSWIIARESAEKDRAATQMRLGEMSGEDLADRAGQLSEVARRIGNISLLITEASGFQTLEAFAQESVLEMSQTQASAGIQVMTVHASKGLEFDHVRLPFWIEGVMPHGRAVEEGGEAVEEERRLAYVAITRARKTVGVSAPISVRGCGFIRQNGAETSRFVDEMAGNRSVHFIRKGENPPHLYLSAGSPQPRPEPAPAAAPSTRAPIPTPVPVSVILSEPPQLSEGERFHAEDPGWAPDDLFQPGDPGWSEADADLIPDFGPDVPYEEEGMEIPF
ncbi:DNA helicase-2/ATP-dependent DNA helicase PcrA [Gemmobacter caeni]|uniref:DNA 3'-5' helicase n=1 Tax=Gemmobacter caeni TaxID=589035 RepID=A0A2T6B8V2_9RHOB|nr:ATP-dependent helicase [Gemmobacter caeni]PTX52510.1 DNA helicase-2/ATP-dependent DNA helicase PcrA [Gemmobacter caeni]TWJ02819.1 DNA helicase-2/ATP-dependent DNA helicase PcrA [Gemmobacter caeni]